MAIKRPSTINGGFIRGGFRRRLLKPPLGYITFHVALNQLGHDRIPGVWNVGPEWKFVPYYERNKQIGFWSPFRVSPAWTACEIAKPHLFAARSANKHFAAIAGELIQVLSNDIVHAYVVAGGDRPTKIVKRSMRWEQQADFISSSGFMKWSRDGASDRRRLIVIKRSAWDKWLTPSRPDKDFNKADPQLCVDLIDIFSRQASACPGARYAFASLWKLVEPNLRRIMTQADFKRRVYQALSSSITRNDGKRGPSLGNARTFLKDYESQLRNAVNDAVADFESRVNDDEE